MNKGTGGDRAGGEAQLWLDKTGVLHVHSRHSDGIGPIPRIARAASRAGVDFVFVTDHDTLAGRERGEAGWYGDTLVLVGQEVSPPEGNHFLVFGLDEVISRKLLPEQFVEAAAVRGGLGFVAHPHYPEDDRYPLKPFPWNDWSVTGFAGIEIWNYTVDWLTDVTPARLAPALLWPGRTVDGPDPRTLARWDKLLAAAWTRGRRVVGIGGVDAHGILYSYRRMFRALRTHILVNEDWSGDWGRDEEIILEALREGRAYVAYDELHDATGFQFFGEAAGERVPMGDRLSLSSPGTAATTSSPRTWLTVRAPAECLIKLKTPRGTAAEAEASTLEYRLTKPGVYRAEAWLPGRRGWRPWVFTNPIYVG